jgi:nicotinamidase-related amidase
MAGDRQGARHAVPHSAPIALLIIDMIADFEFENGDRLFRAALPASRNIARLKERARAATIPIVYVNDNFGQWRSNFQQLLQRCLNDGVRGEPIARLLAPDAEDYFVLKPAHSGFFATPLQTLLQLMGARTLVLTGVAAHQCILFTAADAYLREYDLVIPRDCVAAAKSSETELALHYFKSVLKADIRNSSSLKFAGPRERKRSRGAREMAPRRGRSTTHRRVGSS